MTIFPDKSAPVDPAVVVVPFAVVVVVVAPVLPQPASSTIASIKAIIMANRLVCLFVFDLSLVLIFILHFLAANHGRLVNLHFEQL